jgi:hypothetical protein
MIDWSVPSPPQKGRCGPARTELYRTGIGACTRFAGIFIALVSASIVAPSSYRSVVISCVCFEHTSKQWRF